MPAIQVNFQGKEEDRDWTPQPPTGKIGTALVLPPDCKVAYTQRLLRVSNLMTFLTPPDYNPISLFPFALPRKDPNYGQSLVAKERPTVYCKYVVRSYATLVHPWHSAVWDEHLGKTLYKAKMDSKNKIMSVYREGRPPVTPAGKIATMALDGKSGLAGDTSDINLPNGQNGPVGSVFRKCALLSSHESVTMS